MKNAKKILSITILVFTFIGALSLSARCRANEIYQSIEDSQNAIQQNEDLGDYTTALEMARKSYSESLKNGLTKETTQLAHIVKRMEEKLLTLGFSRLLFDEHNQPRAKLLQLLNLAGMEPLNKSESAIVQINNWAQKNLLRQNERWGAQTNRFEELKPKIQPLLGELGFIDAALPHFKEYQGVLLHGALLPRVRLRLHYLVEQWKNGVRFSHFYFLSGERPLDFEHENVFAFLNDRDSLLKIRKGWSLPKVLPNTECEMIQLIWEQSEIPADMRNSVTVCFINAPMKKDAKSGTILRPTTDDTMETWLKAGPPHGCYLAITNAPYTYRQDLVVRTMAPKEYTFETIGSAARTQEKVSILLNEVARCIFQTKKHLKRKPLNFK